MEVEARQYIKCLALCDHVKSRLLQINRFTE